jgi:8-oxo-dGTP pyrophosphatase MutT (NUDIX family)
MARESLGRHAESFTAMHARLSQRLAAGLPGRAAHRQMEPELSFGRHSDPAPRDARPAAVMLLLFAADDDWHLPLVVRPPSMVQHGGQVGLPGGMVHPGEDTAAAALRELGEELGVPPHDVALLGALSPVNLFVSNIAMFPWLALCPRRPDWQPDAREVVRLLELPVRVLWDPTYRSTLRRRRHGIELSAPCLRWQGETIWGATAIVLAELAALLRPHADR